MNARAQALEPAQPVRGEVVQVGGASLMEVISRAAADPSTDVDKLERLLGMYERITARDAEQSYHAAMNAAQEEMRPIAADANNPQTKSKYASYAALDRVLRPIYTKHGFSISFDTADGAPAEHLRVVGKVGHRDGHKEAPHLDMPADGKGAKGGDVMTKTHATGAAITYGKRYLLGMVFNIAVGEDNDGNSPVQFISEDQMSELVALMDEVAADRTKFLNFLRVDTLAHLPAHRYRAAIQALEAKRKAG